MKLGIGADMRVLLIEDDASIVGSIELILKHEGVALTVTALGSDGLDLATAAAYDLIVLDLGLPDMSGTEVLQSLRKSAIATPVMILSGIDGIQQKVTALAAGADDYLTKPFHRDEFTARLHAIVRRGGLPDRNVLHVGELTIDLDSQTAEIGGKQASLTVKEFQILTLLASRQGSTISKEMLLNHLYAGMDEPELKIIDVFVCKLRRKLSEASGGMSFIDTVWGRGYMIADQSAAMRMAS